MPTLNTYQLLDKELPAILMVVLVFLAFIVALIVTILRRRSSSDNGNSSSDDELTPLVSTAKAKERGVEVFHQKINHQCFDVLVILLIPVMVGIMFITFWNVYLVEEAVRGDCEPNFDCFPKVGNNFLQQEPVNNCSVFELNGNVTYECYRLVFRYAEGLGAAGGVLFLFAVLFKIYISLLVTVYNCMKGSGPFRRFILYGVLLAVPATIYILFIAISVEVPLFRETVFQTITDYIQFAMYDLALLVIIVSGVVVVIGIEVEEKSRKKEYRNKD